MKRKLNWLSVVMGFGLLGAFPAMAQEEPAQEETAQEQPAPQDIAAQAAYEQALKLYRNRNFRGALQELAKVLESQPDRADAHYLAGYAHYMLKELQQSLDAFHRSFAEDPNLDPRTIYQKKTS